MSLSVNVAYFFGFPLHTEIFGKILKNSMSLEIYGVEFLNETIQIGRIDGKESKFLTFQGVRAHS